MEDPKEWVDVVQRGFTSINAKTYEDANWRQIIWFGVYQYCSIRVFMTLVALITQAVGRYCQESISPAFAHVWVSMILTTASHTCTNFSGYDY